MRLVRLWRFAGSGLLAVILLALGVFFSGVVQASHNFSDVPAGAFYHGAVEWVFNRGITAGCAAGMYCPNDAVTRGTMAVFLQREGQAVTPTYLDVFDVLSGLDPDANPVICQTTNFPVTGYPRTALVDGQLIINPAGNMGVITNNVYSFDGGMSWNAVNSKQLGGSADSAGYFFSVRSHGRLDLDVGITYRFGIVIGRIFGTADISNADCEMHVAIVNRNGASTPLSPR